MEPEDPMTTLERMERLRLNQGNSTVARPWSLRTMVDRSMLVADRLSGYQASASAVTIFSGLGAAVGMALGWPLWEGYLAGFLPAYLIGAVVCIARA